MPQRESRSHRQRPGRDRRRRGARPVCAKGAIEILDLLTPRLRHALQRIRAVPSDLGETYESVYNLIRRGGRMPYEGRWIEGAHT